MAATSEGLPALPDEAREARQAQLESKARAEVKPILSPWYRSFVRLDPAEHWRKVRAPVLALNGDNDTQVPADVNLAAIAAALRAGGNTKSETDSRPHLNHLFQVSDTGLVDEYETIEQTFDPPTLERLVTWVGEKTSAPGAPR